MRLLALLALWGIPLAAAARAESIAGKTRWSGTVRLQEDVYVTATGTLEIEAGTQVLIGPDLAREGWNRDWVEIRVAGRLLAAGKPDNLIRFEKDPVAWPEPKEKEAQEGKERERPERCWLGLVLLGNRGQESLLASCLFRDAFVGAQVGSGPARFEDCRFVDCDGGVSVGDLRGGRTIVGEACKGGAGAPLLLSCRFAKCRTAVGVELDARPEIRRCLFVQCERGVGNVSIPFSRFPLEGPGPLVERCEFLECGSCVSGGGRVTNSVFERNRLVYEASSHHAECVWSIDRYFRSCCLYWRNGRLFDDDIPLGERPIFADPLRAANPGGDAEALLLGDLEPMLRLSPESPAIGAAADGGDLGIFGKVGARVAPEGPERWSESPLSLDTWLVPGPPELLSDGDREPLPARFASSLPDPGDACGRARWAVLNSSETLAAPGGGRVALTGIRARKAGRALLRVGVEGPVQAFWNGRPVSGERGAPIPVELKPGTNVLFLRFPTRECLRREATLLAPAPDESGAATAISAWTPAVPRKRSRVAPSKLEVSETLRYPFEGKTIAVCDVSFRLEKTPHWLDVARAGCYRVRGAAGSYGPETVEFDAKGGRLHLKGFSLPAGGSFEVEFVSLRDCSGALLDPPARKLSFPVR